ncbi:uncharacterized protein LOC101851012 isoform X2 [Aplysia californica]|uniref:2'-phosphotransferase n=1 Tax=Aplysia californica TaxID=6500 RepID=A0ABM0JE18_APLCA|nr:uncharacterized protein LOC101851012 isoform X2 [Aplysia californica]
MTRENSGKPMHHEPSEAEKEESMKRLGKRLTYILRYGALKEGLEVNENGYVKLEDLPTLGLLKYYTSDELLEHVKSSVSSRGGQRFDWREQNGTVFVRAAYLRNFEKSPYHPGTKVFTLGESCMTYVLKHLDDYDLEDFPDETIIRLMIRRLKRQKKLNSAALTALLVPTLTRLDMEDVYLTNKTLRTLWTQCPNLVAISFRNCGYIITDSVLAQLAKNLPNLQRLNLSGCDHLSSNCLSMLSKRLPHLHFLNISTGPRLTYEAVLSFIKSAKEMTFLDVYYLRTTPEENRTLVELAKEKGVELILRGPKPGQDGGKESGQSIDDSAQSNSDIENSGDEDDEDFDNDL